MYECFELPRNMYGPLVATKFPTYGNGLISCVITSYVDSASPLDCATKNLELTTPTI